MLHRVVTAEPSPNEQAVVEAMADRVTEVVDDDGSVSTDGKVIHITGRNRPYGNSVTFAPFTILRALPGEEGALAACESLARPCGASLETAASLGQALTPSHTYCSRMRQSTCGGADRLDRTRPLASVRSHPRNSGYRRGGARTLARLFRFREQFGAGVEKPRIQSPRSRKRALESQFLRFVGTFLGTLRAIDAERVTRSTASSMPTSSSCPPLDGAAEGSTDQDWRVLQDSAATHAAGRAVGRLLVQPHGLEGFVRVVVVVKGADAAASK
jgi:hypothetical protein